MNKKILWQKKGKIRFQYGKIPDGKDICEKQLFGFVDKIVNTDLNHKEIKEYLPAVYKALDKFDKEELINRFISKEFNRFLDYYRKTSDINIESFQSSGKLVGFFLGSCRCLFTINMLSGIYCIN